MNQRTIIHLIPGEREHLSPSIIESLILTSRQDHFFIITKTLKDKGHYLTKLNAKRDRTEFNWTTHYEKIFQSHNYRSYRIIKGTIRIGLFCFKVRNNPIVLHDGSGFLKGIFLFPIFKNTTWVCWGVGFEFVPTKGPMGWMRNILRKIFLRYVDNVVCLMSPDAEYIKRFHKKKNVYVVPYTRNRSDKQLRCTKEEMLDSNKRGNRVLLGNGGRHVPYYLGALDDLKVHAGKIELTCMLNYGLVRDEKYRKLCLKGRQLFGKDFIPDERFYPRNEYLQYVKSFDIYICNVETQTGLGVIALCLECGVKPYLTGYNYDWFQSQGFRIGHYSEIAFMSTKEFLSPMSLKDKIHNFELREAIATRNIQLREEFYEQLVKKAQNI